MPECRNASLAAGQKVVVGCGAVMNANAPTGASNQSLSSLQILTLANKNELRKYQSHRQVRAPKSVENSRVPRRRGSGASMATDREHSHGRCRRMACSRGFGGV